MRVAMRPVPNIHIRAYFRELGRKGGKATGDKKKRSPEHYAKMRAASVVALREKKRAQQRANNNK